MKKQTLTEGVLDLIYKALAKGKYNQVQKMDGIKNNPEVKRAIKKAELARKDLIKSIEKFDKSFGKSKSNFKANLIKKYGGR
jgi:hypothetical protein